MRHVVYAWAPLLAGCNHLYTYSINNDNNDDHDSSNDNNNNNSINN